MVDIGEDQITGIGDVEVIDLEPAVEGRNVPAEQIDEDALPGFEHRSQHETLMDAIAIVNLHQHGCASVGWRQQPSTRPARRYGPIG